MEHRADERLVHGEVRVLGSMLEVSEARPEWPATTSAFHVYVPDTDEAHARERCAHEGLRWHYRCVHEELIAFSNHAMYGGDLFTVQQRKVILDAIDARIEADAAFAEAWARAAAHEELDRRECVVVASFEPRMLSVANTTHEGPKLRKAFLEYAWDLTHGRRLQADKVLERVRHGGLGAVRGERRGVDGLAAAPLAAQLEARDLKFDLDVGTSGLRVPLAVVDPDDPARYRVAVLTEAGDGPLDAVEAHLHQPKLLDVRGWRVVRVDARAWHRDPEAVVARIGEASS